MEQFSKCSGDIGIEEHFYVKIFHQSFYQEVYRRDFANEKSLSLAHISENGFALWLASLIRCSVKKLVPKHASVVHKNCFMKIYHVQKKKMLTCYK